MSAVTELDKLINSPSSILDDKSSKLAMNKTFEYWPLYFQNQRLITELKELQIER